MYEFMLLGAQAAGFGMNIFASKAQSRLQKIGNDIDARETQLQMQQESLASTEQSLFNSERLRETLAFQRAIYASRGQSAAQGSAVSNTNSSVRAFNADERAREISLGFRKHQLASGQRLRNIGLQSDRLGRKAKLFEQGVNLLSFNNGQLGNMLNGSGSKING
jgi:hypothetical protein